MTGAPTQPYSADRLGSTAQLADTSGVTTDNYAYDVFGALRSSPGTTNDVPFTGAKNDYGANRGPYNLGARYHDPALGRLLSRDPLPGSLRAYGYSTAENCANGE